jgi:hypothetical protein
MPPYTKPISVKVCSYCYSQNPLEVSGFNSIRLEAWFCHKYCHNLALLTSGATRQSDNPDYYTHLIESRKKVFPILPHQEDKEYKETIIQKHKRCLRDDLRHKRVKVIKQIHTQSVPDEIEVETNTN